MKERLPILELLVVGYCAWQGADLLGAWMQAPFDRLGWLALLIWLAPLGAVLRARRKLSGNVWLLSAALFFSFVGGVAELNVLRYAGLALALSGLLPRPAAPWVCAAVAWMPALGWFASHSNPAAILPLRLLIAGAGAAAAWQANNLRRCKT